MTDTISAAVQSATYPKGAERLKALYTKLEKNPADGDLAAYVEFRELSAEYALALQGPNPEFAKIQADLAAKSGNVRRPASKKSRHGRRPVAVGHRPGIRRPGRKSQAMVSPDRQQFRLDRGGQESGRRDPPLRFGRQNDRTIGQEHRRRTGRSCQLKGKFVLIHYWATWCEPCKVDLASLKELQAKYSANGLAIIGVSLDANRQALDDYLSKNHLPWPQLYEPGGLDSRYANEMGILTLPTMILIDADGHVANRGIHISELDSELRTRLK